jgi:hypothetical protein
LAAIASGSTITLDALGQGSVILYMRVKHSTAFRGTAISALTINVTNSATTQNKFTTNFDIYQAVADGNLQEVWCPPMGGLAAQTLYAYFNPTGAALSVMTAGVLNIDILMARVSTPTYTGFYGSGQVL